MIASLVTLPLASLLLPLAHEGHGVDALQGTPAHWVVEPLHAGGALLAVGLLVVVAACVRRRRRGDRAA